MPPSSTAWDSGRLPDGLRWAAPSPRHVTSSHIATAEIVDPRLRQVNASSWTSVTSDDKLVSELLALYFQYEFPTTQFFQKDLFLDDLVQGRKKFRHSYS